MPKSPLSAIAVVIVVCIALPETRIVADGVTESSLGTVNVADLFPGLEAVKRTEKGSSFQARSSLGTRMKEETPRTADPMT